MAQALEDMGIAGKTFLQEALTNTTDPLGAIEEFQHENSILLPSLQPALPLLDLHDLKRLDFHNSVFEVLRDRLLAKIEEISKLNETDSVEKLEAILEKSFPLNKVESLLPVTMCLLKHLPKVSERYINALIKDKKLYKACPIEVKRQIWQKHQSFFGDEVLPLLTQYVKDKEVTLLSAECNLAKNFFASSPKSRRQSHVVKTLTEMIGKNIRLYDMVLQFLRTLFLKTHSVHYCSLRAEILMSLHDLEVTEVCSVDPCYKFTWCLDACIREHFVDVKRARELQGFLDSVRKGHEQVLGDLSMILCDPFAVNTMLWSIMKIIHEVLVKDQLPRDSTELHLLIRMVTLGQSAWDIIHKQVFKEPRVDNEIISRLIPSLMSLWVYDHGNVLKTKLRSLNEKADAEPESTTELKSDKEKPLKKKSKAGKKAAETKTSEDVSTDVSSQLNCIAKFVSKDQVSRILVMWYVLFLIKHRRKTILTELLPVIGKSYKDWLLDSVFAHTLTSHFSSHPDSLADDNLCQNLFNKFLIQAKNIKETQHRILLRLLISVCAKVQPTRLKSLMTRLEPKSKKTSEEVVSLFSKLKEKVEALPVVPPPQDTPTSPTTPTFLGVPTPAPL